ncbi:MAG: tetratricopeptide repeat protein [Beijerinckiaceae bacterium]
MRGHKSHIVALALALSLSWTDARAQDASHAQGEPTAQSLYNDGRGKLAAGDYDGAVASLYAALERLRAEGRGGSADAGLVAGFLAGALEKLDHPQTEQAWLLAFNLLERAAAPDRFIDAASGLLKRMSGPEKTKEADEVIDRLMRRVDLDGVPDEARLDAMNVVTAYYRSSERKAGGDALLMEHGVRLRGETKDALEVRGLARLRRATQAFRDGQISDFDLEIEAAVADLRAAGPSSARELGAALSLRAQMRMTEGVYNLALADAQEAANILDEANDAARYLSSRVMQIRILERVGRDREALALSRELSARYENAAKRDPIQAAMLRLLIVEMTAASGQVAKARELLETERPRLEELEDKLALGQYYDRLAELNLTENDFAGAAKAAETALAIFREARPGERPLLHEVMRKRANASEGLRDHAYGDRAHRELIELSAALFHTSHPEFAVDLATYASFLKAEGRTQEAYKMYMRSLAALERAYGENGLKVAFALNNLALLLAEADEHDRAIQALERALAILGDAAELANRRVIMRVNLANALVSAGRAGDAMAEIERARRDAAQADRGRERLIASTNMVEIVALDALDQTAEAYRKAQGVVANLQTGERQDASNLLAIHLRMAQMAQKLGDHRKALQSTGHAMNLLGAGRIETDGKWRATAETVLPSLWGFGQN